MDILMGGGRNGAPPQTSSSSSSGAGLYVRFRLKKAQTKWGQNLAVVGNVPGLHGWKAERAPRLKTNKQMYPCWESQDQIRVSNRQECSNIEYKYIMVDDKGGSVVWEKGDNHRVDLSGMFDKNQGPENVVVIEDEGFDQKRNPPRVYPAGAAPVHEPSPPQQEYSAPAHTEVKLPKFSPPMGTGGSQDAQNFVHELLDLNSKNITWRTKLEVVNNLMQKYKGGDHGFPAFRTEGLAILSAYLYFINSGQITCGDQGHNRPNHHAGLAYNIYKTLDTDCLMINNMYDENGYFGFEESGSSEGKAKAALPSNCHIIRLLKTQLPSFADQFMCAVPMTRIRDIAHRNDIPKDLKQDIKHRLQNKLHRCAEPSDLKTCEELINRVRHGDYNQDFKHQFEIFYEELKEFFNAQGLDKLLDGIKKATGGSIGGQIDTFWHQKHTQKGTSFDLGCITGLRTSLQNLNLQLVQDHNKKTLYQQTALADIELEKFLFMKVSEVLNHLTSRQDQEHHVLGVLGVVIENIIVSNIEQHIPFSELNCLMNEFRHHRKSHNQQARDVFLLKLKASVERAERFANLFTSEVINVFQDNVFKLGDSLHMDRHSVMVFSESFIRFHLIFQFSKCLDYFQQLIRQQLNLPPYIVISQYKQPKGKCQGRIFHVGALYDCLKKNHQNQPMILFLDEADGTEEIPSDLVQAIILKHDLPQLSHLAIRARQTKITFVCCENVNDFNKLKQQNPQGAAKQLDLKNGAVFFSDIQLTAGATSNGTATKNGQLSHQESQQLDESLKAQQQKTLAQIATASSAVDLMQQANHKPAKEEIGSKSFNSLILQSLSLEPKSNEGAPLFLAPQQYSIPMSVPMKLLHGPGGQLDPEVAKLQAQIDQAPGDDLAQLDNLRAKLTDCLKNLYRSKDKEVDEIASSIQQQIAEQLQRDGVQQHLDDCLLAVRSSSTLEDLDKMAGAGLFDSILNVKLNDRAQVKKAIVDVWLSLFNKRAIISRKQNQILSGRAQMAVLVQRMIDSEVSFIIHSVNPITEDPSQVYIELAIGQGETLASANQSGTPYRLIYDKKNEQVQIVAFASYSYGLFANQLSKALAKRCIDYTQIPFHSNPNDLLSLGAHLGEIACQIEARFGGEPQDIEGCIDGENETYIVQSRNQV